MSSLPFGTRSLICVYVEEEKEKDEEREKMDKEKL